MNQRGIQILATYLTRRQVGRIVRLKRVADDDFIVAIDDVRDGRTQLIRSAADLRTWLYSFRAGECVVPAAAICGRCDRVHTDRDVDGEVLTNCLRCSGELTMVGLEAFLRGDSTGA